MQTLDNVSGLYYCLKFSQPSSRLEEAKYVLTQKSALLLISRYTKDLLFLPYTNLNRYNVQSNL